MIQRFLVGAITKKALPYWEGRHRVWNILSDESYSAISDNMAALV